MTDENAASGGRDFFISYARVDQAWAEWIAWVLEEARYTVLVQAWDVAWGGAREFNWIAGMGEGVRRAARTVVVLSEGYARSMYGSAEWRAAWAADSPGRERGPVVVRVAACQCPELSGPGVVVDLFALPEDAAREALLRVVPLTLSEQERRLAAVRSSPPAMRAAPQRVSFPEEGSTLWLSGEVPLSSVPPRLAHFVGRDSLLDELHRRLLASGTVVLAAVGGMSGVGTSAVAAEYAHRHAGEFDVVWWVPAGQPDLISYHLAGMAPALGLPAGAEPAAVLAALARIPRWLLVFDDAGEPGDVAPFLPYGRRGRVVVTSRRTGWRQFGEVLAAPALTPAESVGLLAGRAPGVPAADADRIADLLGDLPLAVDLAAGYLASTVMPPAQYTDLLAGRLVHEPVVDQPGQAVAALWNLAVRHLEAEHPAAVALLRLCAFCGAEPIPLEIVTEHPDELADGPLKAAVADRLTWEETVGALAALGLARREGDTLSVPRLVQTVTRRAVTGEQAVQARAAVAALLIAALSDASSDAAGRAAGRLLPHVFAVVGFADSTTPPDVLSELCHRAGSCLETHRQPGPAAALFSRNLALNETALGPAHPGTLTSRHKLAHAYLAAGRDADVISVYEQGLPDTARTLGADHPETLRLQDVLAGFYQKAGRRAEAAPLREQILTSHERTLGAGHPDTLAARTELAHLCWFAGRQDEAVHHLERCLTDSERALGPDHSASLSSRKELAQFYGLAGRRADAIPLYEQVVTDRERVLGSSHPDTVTGRIELATVYRLEGRPTDAIPLLEQALAHHEREHGTGHPDTVTVRHYLAHSYREADRLDEAIPQYEHALTDTVRISYGDRALLTRAHLAKAYQEADRLDEAISLYEQALTHAMRVLGRHHLDVARSRARLACAYQEADRLGEAIPLFEQVLADMVWVLGSDDPDTVSAREQLADAYQDADRLDEAIPLYEQAIADSERLFSTHHPETGFARVNLANAYRKAGRLDEAIRLYEQALTGTARVLNYDYMALIARIDLAEAYRLAGRLDESLALIEQAVPDSKRLYGPDHPLTTTLTKNLADHGRQRPERAEKKPKPAPPRRRSGRRAAELPEPHATLLEDYADALRSAEVSVWVYSARTSQVRQYLAWLTTNNTFHPEGDPLTSRAGRWQACRDYESHLKKAKRAPGTISNALSAIEDFYRRTQTSRSRL